MHNQARSSKKAIPLSGLDNIPLTPLNPLKDKELVALRVISETQNPDLDPDEAQRLLLVGIKKVMSAEAVALVLLSTERDGMVLKKMIAADETWNYQFSTQMEEGLISECACEGKQMAFREVISNPAYNAGFDGVLGLEVHSLLCLPLTARGNVHAVLEVFNYSETPGQQGDEYALWSLVSVLNNTLYQTNQVKQLLVTNADLEAHRWELINSRNTLRALFDSIPASMYIVNRHYQLIAINKSRSERVSSHPKQLIGKKCHLALYGLEEPCPGCYVHDTLMNGLVTTRSTRVWGKSEQPTEWEITTYPIYEEGDMVSQAILLEQDVTEKRRLEANLAQSEKLAAVGQLAAGVAHEINNPLTAIIANAQMLQREPDLSEDVRESVKLIELAGIRASQVVKNLLGFARKELFEFSSLDLNENIRTALSLVQHEFVARSVKLTLDLGEDMPGLYASKDHLHGVWINLVLNAIDALEPGVGEICITTRFVQNEFQINFKDNGTGIPEEFLPRIFEPFYTTKPQGHGTGLGLSVCHRIIKQHGGYITVDSEVGVGTLFTIVLPASPRRSNGVMGNPKP